ncbi:MAG TPA: hypothetical protein PLQ97_04470 [Myxococcota bacterium]|nr:hypothetical protein [Myxococcota bacterium]HQK51123.1 hypothetical protein [Myxococcota bacterium]
MPDDSRRGGYGTPGLRPLRTRRRHLWLWLLPVAACASSGPGGPETVAPDGIPETRAVLREVRHPSPLLPGSPITLIGDHLEDLGGPLRLVLDDTPWTIPCEARSGQEARGLIEAEMVRDLGPRWAGTVRLRGPQASTEAMSVDFDLDESIPPLLARAGASQVHLEDLWVLHGDGVLLPGEGENRLGFRGTWTGEGSGATGTVSREVPLVALEAEDRTRGGVRFPLLGPDFGPGRFQGEVILQTRTIEGIIGQSPPLAVDLRLADPEVLAVEPVEGVLGQRVTVTGAGWPGATTGWPEGLEGDSPGVTTFRIQGLFRPEAGEPQVPVDRWLVPDLLGGTVAHLWVRAEVQDDRLVSDWFGARSGTFEGTIQAVVRPPGGAGPPWTSRPLPWAWPLRTTGQAVVVRFLPGFDESLDRLGLASLGPEVRQAIRAAIDAIYRDYDLRVLEDFPEDLDPNHVSILEIGGPDPNGRGLLGLDNTPGKDVGNLRLFDRIGGANAEVQADGFPGFGGVFLDSFLQWSAHPPQGREALPAGAPEAEPAFDVVFDPVRSRAATREEWEGTGDRDRVAQVREAVRVLGRLVGETAAHEIGHSLGLANPYGPSTSYHNATDEPGCLMDAGNARPFTERAALPGAPETRFCHDHPAYLRDVLGPRRPP